MNSFVLAEAKRCLKCKKPKCKEGCPVNTSINEMITLFLDGKIKDAGEMLFNNNPLSIVCSLICPHARQCEGSCVKGIKGTAIQVSIIEHYISDYYLNFVSHKEKKDPNKKVAIIGSGPAGITIAFILAAKGYDITLFDAHDKIGGVLRYGIPEFRLSKDILDKILEKLIDMGIKVRPNTLIGPVLTIDDLFRDGYKAVFIGTGVWRPKGLTLKGESLGHVHYAIDYLKNPEVYHLGRKVCIVGAGNVAMDVARTALRYGSREVTVLFRGGPEHIEADQHEVEYAKVDGVQFEYYKQPVEFNDDGVVYTTTRAVEKEGYTDFEVVDGDNYETFMTDSIIMAIGQGPRNNLSSTTKGLEVNDKGLLYTNNFGGTSRDGVFASGDVVTGAKTVVEAVRISKIVAEAIDEYVVKKIEEE